MTIYHKSKRRLFGQVVSVHGNYTNNHISTTNDYYYNSRIVFVKGITLIIARDFIWFFKGDFRKHFIKKSK